MMKLKKLLLSSSILSVSMKPQKVGSAEPFVLNGNKALNTNRNFRLIDGHPRLSIWDHSINDADQNFDRRAGKKGGELLVHRSTGKCLNAYRRFNGAEVNVYPCAPNSDDPDQNFNIESLSNGEVQIRVSNTNFCIDSPTSCNDHNGGMITLQPCVGNANQHFRVSGTIINQLPILPLNFSSTVYLQSDPFYNAGYAPASTNSPNSKLGAPKCNCTLYTSRRSKELGRNAINVKRFLGKICLGATQARNEGLIDFNTSLANTIIQWQSKLGAVVARMIRFGSEFVCDLVYSETTNSQYSISIG